jgi:hypothetical protein
LQRHLHQGLQEDNRRGLPGEADRVSVQLRTVLLSLVLTTGKILIFWAGCRCGNGSKSVQCLIIACHLFQYRLRSLKHWDRGFESHLSMDVHVRLFCVCAVLDRGFESHLSMDVCVRLFCVCAVLCVGRGLATG